MKNQNATGIILGNRNLGENDKVIYFYSREFGKIKIIAKGARKILSKFTGHLETLNIVEILIYFGPKNIILREISTIKNFKSIRKDLEKLKNGLQIAEITDQLIFEGQQMDGLMELIEENLEKLDNCTKNSLITQSYLIKFLDKTGVIPDFKTISSALELKYIKLLNFLKTQPLGKIEKIALTLQEEKKLKLILKKAIENQTEKSLKSFSL